MRNGGATLFLTILVRTRWPTTSSPSFSLANTADVDAAGAVKLQSAATGRRFGAAEHDADFFADLIDEDDRGLALGNRTGQFSHRLAHQASLQTDMRVADFAVEFPLRNQGRDRVDHDDVDGVRFNEHLGDLHRLFAVARLADEQRFEVDA